MENKKEDSSENKISIIIDTVDGTETEEVDLDSLPLENLAKLVEVMPDLAVYYTKRLIEEQKKN
jgi:hypothetical protein